MIGKRRLGRRIILGVLSGAGLYVVTVFVIVPALSPRPGNLGVNRGQLAECPASPNCVSSQAAPDDAVHYITPIAVTVEMGTARQLMVDILRGMHGASVITVEDDYVYAEFRTPLMRFVDDVELYFDADAGLIHLRSASRLGYGDLDANRQRMEDIRRLFETRAGEPSP